MALTTKILSGPLLGIYFCYCYLPMSASSNFMSWGNVIYTWTCLFVSSGYILIESCGEISVVILQNTFELIVLYESSFKSQTFDLRGITLVF